MNIVLKYILYGSVNFMKLGNGSIDNTSLEDRQNKIRSNYVSKLVIWMIYNWHFRVAAVQNIRDSYRMYVILYYRDWIPKM